MTETCTWFPDHLAEVEVYCPARKEYLPYCEDHGKDRANVWRTVDSIRLASGAPDVEGALWDDD